MLKSKHLKVFNVVYFGAIPNDTSDFDNEIGAKYFRIREKSDKKNSTLFKEKYIVKQAEILGYHVLPYDATSIHKRKFRSEIYFNFRKQHCFNYGL